MKIFFFRTPKPRRYVHKPIYWDPEEDERKEREERVRKELGLPPEDGKFHTSIKRGSFRKLRESGDAKVPSDTSRERRNSNLRLLLGQVDPDRIIVRTPLIPSYNTEQDLLASAQALRDMGVIHLNPFTYRTPNDE